MPDTRPIPDRFEELTALFADTLRSIGEGELAGCVGLAAPCASGPPLLRMAQVQTIGFQLLRLVEELEAERARAASRARGEGSGGSASAHRVLSELASLGPDALAAVLDEAVIEPVLTAHPTEAKRQTVLEHHRELYLLVAGAGDGPLPRAKVAALLERLWRTGEIFLDKPDLDSELRAVRHYLGEVFPAALRLVRGRFEDAWGAAGLPPRALRGPRVRFGDWVGGDRDGHPLVTAEVTRSTLAALRADAIALHRRALVDAARRLSLSALLQPPPDVLIARIEAIAASLGPAAEAPRGRNPGEPWRQLINLMIARLDATAAEQPGAYANDDALCDDLGVLAASLEAVGAHALARAEVEPLLDQVRTFGLTMARLDIRQNSAVHARALDALAALGGVTLADEPQTRREQLLAEVDSARPFGHHGGPLGADGDAVLACYRVLAEEVASRGTDGLGALIVSMTRDLGDLLAPLLFAREVGLWEATAEGPVCPLPVVPLFETIDDLAHAAQITDALLKVPIIERSLRWAAARDGLPEPVLQVMVGYSDSNKDGGLWASRWGLYRAQQQLAEVGRAHGVRIRFFHGRGGTISRGAGPIHRFLRALPHGTLRGDLRLTEQGEVLSQQYANVETAAHHLETVMASVARGAARDRQPAPDDPVAPWLDEVARASREAYQALVRTEGFVSFFAQATPVDAIEVARIGSRPARRSGERTLQDLRAIPWVFAWNQARFALSGWYGTAAGWRAVQRRSPEGYALLVERAHTHPTLHYLISSVATSVASTDPELMAAYAALVDDDALRERVMAQIVAERRDTVALLEHLYGGPLAERRPTVHAAMQRRADALRGLHEAQIALLRRWRAARRAGAADADVLELELLTTINALAAGLGATG